MNQIELYSRQKRKANGIYYTPLFLAQYLSKKIFHYYKKSTELNAIIDPACGDGMLLRCIANELLIIQRAPKIIGIDKDLNAIKSSNFAFNNFSLKNFNSNFVSTDALFPYNTNDSMSDWKRFCENLDIKDGFDIAVCNPPWGANLNGYNQLVLNSNFALAKGLYDIYDLFIEVVLNNLKLNGLYAFILPDSLFSHEQTNLRKLISNNTTIHLIARLGEKIFPNINRACVILIGRKTKPKVNHLVDCFRLSSHYKKKILRNDLTLEEAEQNLNHKIPQARFTENDSCFFNIDLRTEEQNTYNKLYTNSISLSNIVENTRGAEISKKGIICQCSNCRNWMPYPKAKNPVCNKCKSPIKVKTVKTEKIVYSHNGYGNIKLKSGEDLYRYTCFSKKWLNTLKTGINYKNLSIYNGNKILVRKTGIGITASIDYENSIVNQVVYILKLKPEFQKVFTLEFILAILNSRAITYYLIKKHGENEWKSHPYITQTILINLPFPKIDFNSFENRQFIKRITTLIRKEIYNSNEKNISKRNDLLIEKIVAHLFRLNKDDYNAIFKTLNSSEKLIPIKRLLNCNVNEIFQS